MDWVLEQVIKTVQGRKIILFGAAMKGQHIKKVIDDYHLGEVEFFIDNNAYENEVGIYSPHKLLMCKKGSFIVFICAGLHYNEMKNELLEMGFDENQDFIVANFLENYFTGNQEYPYESVYTLPGYAPWRNDSGFIQCYQEIENNTLCDIYRLYTLWSLINEVQKLSHGIFLEIGSWRGGSGCLIARRAANLKLQDTVYLCDTFRGVVKAGENDPIYIGGEHSDTSKEIVQRLIGNMSLQNVNILEGIFPDDTGNIIKNDKIRFCHIDVDVYQSGKDIMEFIWEKLIPGGIVVFDDYGGISCPGIQRLVSEFRGDDDKIVIENLSGQGIIIKR